MINYAVSEAAYVVQAAGVMGFVHIAEGRAEDAEHIFEPVRIDSQLMQDGFARATRDALQMEFALRQGNVDKAHRLRWSLPSRAGGPEISWTWVRQ